MPRRIRLNPIDNMLAVFDHTLQRVDGLGFNCVLVLTIEGHLDGDRLARAVDTLGRRHGLTRARLCQPWWAKRPAWTIADSSSIPVDVAAETAAERTAAATAEEILNRPLDPRRDAPVQVFVRPTAGGEQALMLKWSHVLTDGRGGDFLLQELGRCYDGSIDAGAEPVPLRPGPLSLSGPAPSVWRPKEPGAPLFRPWNDRGRRRVRLRVLPLDDAESARLRQTASRVGGFGRQGAYTLAAWFRVMQREAERMDAAGTMVRAHWPVGLREGPPTGSLPGNEYGFVYLERPAAERCDTGPMVEQLTREIIASLGRGEHRRAWRTARLFWHISARHLRWINDRTRLIMRSDPSTTHFRYGGRLLGGARTWGGLLVTGGFAATVCWREKPLAIGISETAGRFHLGATWVEDSIEASTAERLLAVFRDELLGSPPPAG